YGVLASATTSPIWLQSGLYASTTLFVTATTTLYDDLVVDTDTLFVDSYNDRVGIGTASPDYLLDVNTGTAEDGIIVRESDSELFGAILYGKVTGGGLRIYRGGTDFDNPTHTIDGAEGVVFNEISGDIDFRVEGGTNEDLLFVNAGTDMVGIGTSTPITLLTVGSSTPGSIASTNYYNSGYISGDLEVDGRFYADGSATSTFASTIDVDGTATSTFAGAITIGDAYTLPSIDGTTDYVLKTDGSGNVTWQADTDTDTGDVFAWTPSTTYGVLASATTSPIWLQSGLYASTTLFVTATTTLYD
ncbi:MAG: hypothetical protein GY800_09900, partial [Planctomycetes bacterium]|nr:hypothetical protein [Planctomycetota bacterium]